jgi:hypothetical protein
MVAGPAAGAKSSSSTPTPVYGGQRKSKLLASLWVGQLGPCSVLTLKCQWPLADSAVMYVYPAHGHPEGTGASPWFRVQSDYLYPAHGHPEGTGASPWFRVQGDYLYPAHGHPEGTGASPWYAMR